MSEITVDELLQSMLTPQLSEAEAANLFESALQEYRSARDGVEPNVTMPSPLLITPQAWWLM